MTGTAEEWNAHNLMAQLEKDRFESLYADNSWALEKKVGLTPFDDVERPQHYNNGKVEAIEAIKASMSHEEYLGYLKGNTIKYLWRYRYKGKPLQDLDKAQWYLSKLKEEHK